MRWLVEVEGNDGDLEDVAYALQGGSLDLVSEDGRLFLRSDRWDALDKSDVWSEARDLEPLLNGAARLATDLDSPLRIGSVWEILPDGQRRKHAFLEAHVTLGSRFRVQAELIAEGSEPGPPPISPAARAFDQATMDPVVAKALRLFGLGPTWGGLYNVLDVVAEDVGGETALERAAWVPAAEFRRFRQTANSHDAIGAVARHAKSRYRPPAKPMRLNEATSLVRNIVDGWIRNRDED